MRKFLLTLSVIAAFLLPSAFGLQRFPPPDFESGYRQPPLEFQYQSRYSNEVRDALLLIAALAVAGWFLLYKRNRTAIFAIGLASLLYFGFYKQGCICPIGSIQNVAYAISYSSYTIPVAVLIVFFAPLVCALILGRIYCGSVCPLGAIQDIFLFRSVRIPGWLGGALGLLRYFYLGLAVFFVVGYERFTICEYDPFVSFFRWSGAWWRIGMGAAFLLSTMFIGRVYCRFLCPYGAILSFLSRWTSVGVRVTPDDCVKCTLCEDACPFGAILQPGKRKGASDRTKAFLWLLAVVLILGLGVAFYYVTRRSTAGMVLGMWFGLVIGSGMLGAARGSVREEYSVDYSACFSCGRCYEYCPRDRAARKEKNAQC
jgi:polyferredoxin